MGDLIQLRKHPSPQKYLICPQCHFLFHGTKEDTLHETLCENCGKRITPKVTRHRPFVIVDMRRFT